jgi:hypothetical protein
MANASKAKQLGITLGNKVGLLAEVTGAISAAKVNITALCGYAMGDQGIFWMLTDGNAKAKKALSKLGGKIVEDDVVLIEMADKTGELKKIADRVAAAGIEIDYVYATAGAKTKTLCVMMTADNKKAIKVINAK